MGKIENQVIKFSREVNIDYETLTCVGAALQLRVGNFPIILKIEKDFDFLKVFMLRA